MPGIVVAVDGSPNAERALEWAMGHAAALQVPLIALAVHEVPKSYWGGIPVVGPADDAVLGRLRQAAEEMTHQVRAVSGFVVKEIVDASQDADLVVVGPRGGHGFARLIMGSVSTEVIQQSKCPVVIVPPQK